MIPSSITVDIYNVSGILLVFLYILGVIIYASILGIIILTIVVNNNSLLLTTEDDIKAIILVNNEPIYGIKVLIEFNIPSNK